MPPGTLNTIANTLKNSISSCGVANGAVSHVEGFMNSSNAVGSYVGGVKFSDNNCSHTFVWSGFGGDSLTNQQIKVLANGPNDPVTGG